jgi:hypothetical protein
MLPWAVWWENRRWAMRMEMLYLWRWHKTLLFLAALGLAFLIHLAAAHSEECGNYLTMDRDNLACAERYLATHGHQVKAYEGIAMGPLESREQGTGVNAIRGRDKQGCWLWWVWENQGYILVRIRTYPAKQPVDFKGE